MSLSLLMCFVISVSVDLTPERIDCSDFIYIHVHAYIFVIIIVKNVASTSDSTALTTFAFLERFMGSCNILYTCKAIHWLNLINSSNEIVEPVGAPS